ncbi:MAG: IS200/IS605 family transposase [Candidatus Omnitrophica bacterium]|nr:IS200/IS605 family transposase [Candidatus Omnitrophota bacterium]
MYYHIWFVTKRRRETLEAKAEEIAKNSFLEVAQRKNYNILEMESNKNHVHMLLEAKDRKELADMVRTLKSVSGKKLLENTPHLRVGNYNPKHFWARRYGFREVDIVELESVQEYIRSQRILHT